MAGIDKIEKVVEILQHSGRLRRTELVNRLMKEGDMQKQTAYNAIDDAKELGKIKREERRRGKELKAFYTVHFDIEENENELFASMEKRLKEFDNRFDFFKDKFSKLPVEEKATGIESFAMLHLLISSSVHSLWINFGETNEWKTLLDKVDSRNPPIYELMRTCPLEEGLHIARRKIEGKIESIDDVFNQQEEFLKEIRSNPENS